ncbi:MAG: serine/threonine-protein kinase [Pirellulales bacterium]
MSSNHSSTFVSLLADVLRRIDCGEPIDRERLLADHEDLRSQLESFFNGDSLVANLAGQADLSTNGHGQPSPAPPGRFADFELLEEIGRGGMGVVYKARQARPDRIVALKMVLAGRHASPTALKRFQTEAESAARLRHPSIVPIHQVGEHDDLAYYVMDYIEGESLEERLSRGPLSPRMAAEMLLEIARAVEHAHHHGVIHRDLKPANILVECSPLQCSPLAPREETHPAQRDAHSPLNPELSLPAVAGTLNPPRLYISDFGLARRLDTNDQLTATGEVVGTASFMAPEQAGFISRSEMTTMGPAVDIYGLGAVLYAMLTGRPPFQTASRDETIAQLKTQDPAPPRSINAAIPRDLETIALKCLQKSPLRRYPSAAALAEDLARYLAGKPITARPVGRVERSVRLLRRNPVTSALVSLLALSLVAGAVVGVVLSIQANRHASDSAHHLYVAHMNLAQQYWDAGRAGPVLDILRRYIPKEGEPDMRGWEWHYQWSLCHRELRRFGEWPGGVQCVAVSPDGRLTAAAGDDGVIQLFDTATGDRRARLSGHQGAIYALAFSPNGDVLASGGIDRQIRLWDVASLPLLPLGEGRGEGRNDAPHLDPGLPAVAGTLNLEPIATLSRHTNDIRGLSFSPNGSWLVSSSEGGNAWLWDMKNHEAIRSIATGPARAITFHPDGKRFACAARDGVIHLWDVKTGERTASWQSHSYNVYGLAFNRAGDRLFSAGSDCVVCCTDTSSGDTVWSVKHAARFYCLSLAADERTLAAGSDDQTIRLYDAVSGNAAAVYRSHTDWIHGVGFLPDGSRLVSASADGTVRLWNELCAGEGRTLNGHEQQVVSLTFSPDGQALATASQDGSIGLWDSSIGLLQRRLQGPVTGFTSVAFRPDGKSLVAGGQDHNIHCLSTATAIKVLRGHSDMLGGVAYSPDALLLGSASADDTVRLWDVAERRTRRVLRADAGNVGAVTFSPNGKLLATTHEDGTVRTWNLADAQIRHVRRAHSRNARDACFAPDGTWFASCGSDGAVRLWDTASGEELKNLRGHDGTVYSVAVNADGNRVVSGGNDQTVKLWDVSSGQELRTLRFGEQVRSVAFSPDGRQIAASGAKGTVRIWNADPAGRPRFEVSSGENTSTFSREALGLVIRSMENGLSKSDSQDRIQSNSAISEPVRTAALAFLNQYSLDEFASHEGHRLAESGDWPAAAAAFARAAENAPNNFEHWYLRALCERKAGQNDQYSEVCRRMVGQFESDTRPYCLARTLAACLLVSPASVPLEQLQPIADRLHGQQLRAKKGRASHEAQRYLALWELRMGNPLAAEGLMPLDAGRRGYSLVWHSQMAVIQAELGNRDAALENITRARAAEGALPWPWHYHVVSEYYCEEARQVLDETSLR